MTMGIRWSCSTARSARLNADSGIVRPEHAVQMFRLLGATAPGGPAGSRQAQLALLPGTSHEGMLDRVDWLSSMIARFLMP
jgi:hypothetical protein